MPFNEKSQLDPSQVQDRRGRSTGRTIAVGGGGISLIILIVALILGIDPNTLAGLTGGSQQSNEVTSGEISDLAAQGLAIILISSDLPEVLAMSDRVLVMREGRQMGIFDRAEATQERVMTAAMGQDTTSEAQP